jgi:hypothetical protein
MRSRSISAFVLSTLLGSTLVLAGTGASDTKPPTDAAHRDCPHHGGGHHGKRHHGHHWATPEQRTQRMQQHLGLSDEQAGKVGEINRDFAQSMGELRQRIHEQHRAEFDAIFDKRNTAMKGVLDDKQYQQYLQHQERRKQHRESARTPAAN